MARTCRPAGSRVSGSVTGCSSIRTLDPRGRFVTRMPPLSAGAAGGTAGRAALSALGERGAGVPDTADGSGLGEVAVAGCGTGAAGDGGGGVGGIFLVVSPRALSAPSVV